MKAILTCAGFDNDNHVGEFQRLIDKPCEEAKALFIPTALSTPEAREYVNVFIDDLHKVGITDENIDSYDLDVPFDPSAINAYDVVFFCPGDPVHLLSKVNEMSFYNTLKIFLDNGGVYVGVSAGSDIAALNLPGNLGYLNATIECHSNEGSANGPLDTDSTPLVKLTDNQAIIINGDEILITE